MRVLSRWSIVFVTMAGLAVSRPATAQVADEGPPSSPATGFNIHVTAPHIMGEHLIDPMHHFCKLISQEPVIIQCLMFAADAGADPNARLLGIEYIVDKSLTREKVNLGVWNRNWHDHVPEIEAGLVGLPELSGEEAKKIVEVVSGTDGIVFITWPELEEIPSEAAAGIAQALSHEIVTPEEHAAPLAGGN